jgi:1-acyl-sn-glycerol-3-phosphate acyltransferase
VSDVPADDYRIATPDRFWGFWRLLLQRLFTWFFRMRVYGAEHVPRTGPAVIASNHIAGIDVVVLGAASPRTLRYMAKAELFTYNRALTWMLRHAGAFGVRRGESDLEALRLARRVLRAGHALGVFCEGTRQPSEAIGPVQPGGTDRPRRGRTDRAGRDPGHDLHQAVAAASRHGHVRPAARRRADGAARKGLP